MDISNIIQKKIKNKNEAKEIILEKESNNINKNQENKPVNFSAIIKNYYHKGPH